MNDTPKQRKKIITDKAALPSPIVAIGASAGGLPAIIQFLESVPVDSNMVFVIITHLNPELKSMMSEVIQTHTQMPVKTINQRCKIAPNTVYVIPPNKNIIIQNDELLLVEQYKPHYANSPIDCFFHSLALAYEKNAVAVVLSGCGSDGSKGLKDIKLHGGLVVVQSPQTAEYDSMPLNAMHTSMVDAIAAPEEMFQSIKALLIKNHSTNDVLSVEFHQICAILQARTGNNFSGYKTSVLKRRIDRQLRRLHISNMADYINYLQMHAEEADLLFKDLLIGVTCFFRDSDAFNELKQSIIPTILKNKTRDFIFRAWVPGCSTGQEAYSIAIILREYMQETNHYFHAQLFCTDIDHTALDIARSGIYPTSIAQEVSKERLATYFTKDKHGYKVNKDIREMIVFGIQNVIQDPPFTKLDLISCRNLLIYLSAASQRMLFPLLHFSLKPGGILFLGKSESAGQHRHLFKPHNGNKYKFFDKIEYINSDYRYFNTNTKKNALNLSSVLSNETFTENNLTNLDQTIKTFLMDTFVSPCVLMNKQGDILFTQGELSPYLNMSVQLIHSNFMDIIQPHIKAILLPFFRGSAVIKLNEYIAKILPDPFSKSLFIKIMITPIHHLNGLSNLILVRFEKTHTIKPTSTKETHSNQLLNMEHELHLTKENLQSTIEELETSNEEMQSTNEEIQSINEELETSKEELQAVNEELLIVNTELQNRIEETSAINDDMNTLFNNADIAAIFLDGSLIIKQFTPKTQELINLIPADIGRSFRHFSTNINTINLIELSEDVLKTHQSKTFEVQAMNARWYLMSISPYHTPMNKIDGVVITFMEITQTKLNEANIFKLNTELHDATIFLDNILDAIREAVVVLDCNLKIVSFNNLFCKQFSLRRDDIVGRSFYDIGEAQWNIPDLRTMMNQVVSEDIVVDGFELDHEFPRVGHKQLVLNIRKLISKEDKKLILLAIETR